VLSQPEQETSENIVKSAKMIETSNDHNSLETDSKYEVSCSAKEIEFSDIVTCASSENSLSANNVSQPSKSCNEEII